MKIAIKLQDAFDFLKPVGNGNIEKLEGDKYGCVTYGDCLKQQYPTFIRSPKRFTNEGTKLEIGDILIPSANLPNNDNFNIAYLFCSEVECVAGEGLHILRKKIEIDPFYVCIQINSEPMRHKIKNAQCGSSIRNLYSKDFQHIEFIHPVKFDLEETQKINDLLIGLEEKLEYEKLLLDNYEKQKKYLLNNMMI